MPGRPSGGQGALLHERIVSGVSIESGPQEPLRTGRLSPVEAQVAEVIPERNGHIVRRRNRTDAWDEPLCRQTGKGLELGEVRGAVSDAGVFVDRFERRKEEELILNDRTAQRGHVVLPRERLLRQRRGILYWVAGVQRGGALVEGFFAVPEVGAALGGDLDRAAHGAADVRILLRRLHGEFLDRIRRKILQEAADPIVRVVGAIHGIHIVESGTAAEGDRRDARLRRVGGLHRFGAGNEEGDIGEAAVRQRNGIQILGGNRAAVNGAGGIDRLGDDGGCLPLHIHRLPACGQVQRDGHFAHGTHHHRNLRTGIGEPGSLHAQPVLAGQQIVEAELAAGIGLGLACGG